MKPHDLKSMSVEELWSLHELIVSVLASKISAEKARLEQRLRELGQSAADSAKKVMVPRGGRPQNSKFNGLMESGTQPRSIDS